MWFGLHREVRVVMRKYVVWATQRGESCNEEIGDLGYTER